MRSALALLLMLASGFAALGYQIVWTQQTALLLGHDAAGVLAVVGAFFGGLAIGALVISPFIERASTPWRWYAACEALIALWSVLLAFTMMPIANGMLSLIGSEPSPLWHWSVAFMGTFLLLLPATAAMGATMPAMERALSHLQAAPASIAALYAANTAGAVVGVLAAAFWLIPSYGLIRTASVCAVLNVLCAAAALVLFRAPASTVAASTAQSSRDLYVLALTGAFGIGYEVVVVRVLSHAAENTVYTFALILAVYLIGTTIGASAYHRWPHGAVNDRTSRNRLLLLVAGACGVGIIALPFVASIKQTVLGMTGPSVMGALLGEAAIAVAAFFLPTLAMGALFSHLTTAARARGVGFARALGVNTLGAAAAPLICGLGLVPLIGPKYTLLGIVCGYLAVLTYSRLQVATLCVAATAIILYATAHVSFVAMDVPAGGHIVHYDEGILGSVSIIEDADGVARLHINNRQQEGSSATLFADGRQGLLPLLLHGKPERALFLGLGTGLTSSAVAAADPHLAVDVVELLPEVIEASTYFVRRLELEPSPRRRMIAADARRFVRSASEQYDVIVADNFHPARSGSGALYTVEHFAAIRQRLAVHGVFCQWLPLHQLDLDTLRIIVRTFLQVYPNGAAILATNSLDTPVIGLLAHRDSQRFDVAAVRARISKTHAGVDTLALSDDFAVLGSFIADSAALARFAAYAPLNTDDRPLVSYRAPRITYAPDSRPRDRLIELVNELTVDTDTLVAADAAWRQRLSGYIAARNRFIEAGRDVQPTGDVHAMLAQVHDPLLDVLRISPDFRPAYEPLLRMAHALADRDPEASRHLLAELQDVRGAIADHSDPSLPHVGF